MRRLLQIATVQLLIERIKICHSYFKDCIFAISNFSCRNRQKFVKYVALLWETFLTCFRGKESVF